MIHWLLRPLTTNAHFQRKLRSTSNGFSQNSLIGYSAQWSWLCHWLQTRKRANNYWCAQSSFTAGNIRKRNPHTLRNKLADKALDNNASVSSSDQTMQGMRSSTTKSSEVFSARLAGCTVRTEWHETVPKKEVWIELTRWMCAVAFKSDHSA